MYFRIVVLFQFAIMSLGYFFAVLIFWSDFKSYVFLLGIIPLIVNITVFSSFFLNYLSLLLISLMVLNILGHPLDYMLYESTFWGVQGVLFVTGAAVAILRCTLLPILPTNKQKFLSQFMRKYDQMTVTYDTKTQTITDITSAASKFYGWKKKHLLNHPMTEIHLYNFFENPPYHFWETLTEGKSWHGFFSIFTKKGVAYEERVVVSPIFDKYNGSISALDKQIVEVISNDDIDTSLQAYKQLFYKHPVPTTIINTEWVLEDANNHFQEKFAIDQHRKCLVLDIFPSALRHKIQHAIEQAWTGQEVSFIAKVEQNPVPYVAEFKFLPYKKINDVLKIFFIVQDVPQDATLATFYEGEQIQLSHLLRNVLTDMHQDGTYSTRIFSGNLPVIHSNKEQWYQLLLNLFALPTHCNDCSKITVTCTTSYEKHFFKFIYEDISSIDFASMFNRQSKIENSQYVFSILDSLEIEPTILSGEKAILCFTYQE